MERRVEVIEFNGVKFKRYPDAPRLSDRRYYKPGWAYRKGGVEALHREIWKQHHGPIPEGHHIHHIDGDTGNNAIDNLECLPGAEHLSRHSSTDEARERNRANIEAARPYAAAWHRSEAGREWHREHGKAVWENREPQQYVCEQCGATYSSLKPSNNRFCSGKCKAKYRRDNKLDHEDRTCESCGSVFSVSRFAKSRYCSRQCAWDHRKLAARELRLQSDS